MNVCLNQLKDLQLAIAITRVYEGDQGPVLRKLLEEEVLNIAAQEGNRWLASWAFWMLHRRDMAVRALIVSTPIGPCIVRRCGAVVLTSFPRRLCIHWLRHQLRRT